MARLMPGHETAVRDLSNLLSALVPKMSALTPIADIHPLIENVRFGPMRCITIKRARTWRYRKVRPCIEKFSGPVSLSPFQSWPDCIINTSGYDFRKGQVSEPTSQV